MNKFAVGTMIAAVLALIGVGANAAYESHQTNKKIGKATDELRNATIQDITDSMLKEAVTRAANLSVDKYILRDNESIMNRANVRLSNEIASLVKGRYDEVTKDVGERVARQVTELDDPNRLKDEVVEKAQNILLDRFNADISRLRNKAEEAFTDANTAYEEKLDELSASFEDKLDDKLEDYSEHLATMKKLSDVIENAFGRRGEREGKEIRFTLG